MDRVFPPHPSQVCYPLFPAVDCSRQVGGSNYVKVNHVPAVEATETGRSLFQNILTFGRAMKAALINITVLMRCLFINTQLGFNL